MTDPGHSDEAIVVPYQDGPVLIRGRFRVVDQEGKAIDTPRATVALCRCGQSGDLPFCDGSHRLVHSEARASSGDTARPVRHAHDYRSAPISAGECGGRFAGLPAPAGPLSGYLVEELGGPPRVLAAPPTPRGDSLSDDDLHQALYLCYEVGYRGFAGVNSNWADEPSLIALRRLLSERFIAAVMEGLSSLPEGPDMPSRLEALIAADDSPSVADYLLRHGTEDQMRELLMHRSAYLLKEADPHARVLPWLSGRPKAALAEILADEYGGGRMERMHAVLYAQSLRTLGMDWRENGYLDLLPGVTLATVNLTSVLCERFRWRGALLGHLAVTEMTSSAANRHYGAALRRLGLGRPEVTDYFDEHVEADAVHDVVAAHDMAGSFARSAPHLAESVLRGAQMLLRVEGAFARHVLASWAGGRSSLRRASESAATVTL